ncbi:MAG: type II secretion system secretin GspD [Telluria sp.]
MTRLPALRLMSAAALLCCAFAGPAPAALAAEPETAALNFVGADIESVIKAVGHYTGITFIIDPRVKGTLTLVSEKSLTKSQAFALLTSALRLQGYTVVSGDGYAKVVPEVDAKIQSSPTQVGTGAVGPHGDQVLTQVYHLQYESAVALTTVLRPLISPNNSITANAGNNSLVITDYADNLKRLSKIIAALDAPVAADLDVIPVHNAVASDIATMVTKLLDTGGQEQAGRTSVVADPRTNSVVIRAPSPARANLARSLITKLDQPTAQAGNVHVVYLKNADATKLAQTLRAVVSGDTAAIPAPATGTAGGSVGNMSGQTTNSQQGGLAASSPLPQSLAQQNANQPLGGGTAGFIQADPTTNTLIITASEAVYRNLRGVIDMLDVRRAQLYIESLVVEVTSNQASDFGIQWLGLSGDSNSKYRVGGAQVFNASSGNGLTQVLTNKVPGPGLSIGVFKQIDGQLGLGAVAHALETSGHANILSTPNIVTLDNELAIIKVGQNVPIISGQFTTNVGGGTTTGNPFQTIDRKDVGLTMKIRPQISEGGTIKMAIYHETSSVDKSTLNAPAGVTTNIRVIEDNVIADDGQIVVLGGLIDDTEGDGEEKVRGLGDIPVLGNLFKYRTRERTKRNLMIFLRPVIVRSKEQNDALAMDRYDYMRATGETAQPKDDSLMLKNLGAPVLPALSNGQPPAGGSMAQKPAPATTATSPAANK